MGIEDHPKFDEWSKALDRLKEANDRYRQALKNKSSDVELYRIDLYKARKAYNDIASEIE